MEKLIYIAITLISAVFVMLIHETTKNIAYYIIRKTEGKQKPKGIFCIWKAIDLVGIITALSMYTPFSKQYKYTISNKKTSLIVGITGFVSLMLCFAFSIVVLKLCFQSYITEPAWSDSFIYYTYLTVLNIALFSVTMFLVNLFPITCFDMGLVILGSNSKNRSVIVVFDGLLKLVFFFMIVLRVFLNLSTTITNYLIAFFI